MSRYYQYPQSLTSWRTPALNIYSNPIAIVYKIICSITGKYYIGKTIHIIDFLNKKYERGQGSFIQNSLNKYGYDNHDFTIIAYFFNEDDAFAYEEELTPFEEIYPQNPMSLNLKTGGKGNSSHDVKGEKNGMYGKGYLISGKNNPMFNKVGYWYGKSRTNQCKQKSSETQRHKQYDHIIQMLNDDDETKSPSNRKHKCLLCEMIFSKKGGVVRHLKRVHFFEKN